MKELSVVLVLACLVALSHAAQQCCADGETITKRGFCSGGDRARINCTSRWLLKDAFLIGDKLYSQDAPNFVFVEDPTLYCLSDAPRNFSDPSQGIVPSAMVCFDTSSTSDMEVTGILTLTSVVFLLATLAVYMYLPQMRDLQGLCYISLCISMALGFLSLGVLQLSPGFRDEICTLTGFIVYFWMMATFFWMNVISINTYRSIDDPAYLKKTERQQYFRYSCFAWGGTMLFLIVSLTTNFAEGDHWKPGFGKNSCWFQGATETWIFFYGPVALLITGNVLLFIASSWILWRQTRKYEVDKLNNLKHKFLLSLKLFLVMGISWVFEIASFAHGKTTVLWKIMDTFNCLQGVVIFILLVILRRRAMRGLASEGCCLPVTRPLADKLSPHDDEDAQHVLTDDTMEVRLN
ncbi:probable G-protein coupled receptor Mth-like 2 [Pectinophora gossypiella]|uniref:probable G-protein coupled receptor Mth-like 2 n=1 Tax=Pectinophora gossypiella TaxID=13191 RepID=UPI00214E2832|nr:probable G-protein coupled receptor Mth-like 2 [Pectinophora gossypiella]